MGSGAIFVGMMAETLVPILLIFPLSYYAMVKHRGLQYGWRRTTVAFLAAFLGGGLVYASLCLALGLGSATSVATVDLSNVLIIAVPLAASILALLAFNPRLRKG